MSCASFTLNKFDQVNTKTDFQRVLLAIESFRKHDRSASGMIFTDNWYDSHPRLLIFDPILTPYDKMVWLAIRAYCTPDMSLTAFPSYDQIQSLLHISRGTVSSSIAKLRVTRWVTLICRDRVRNSAGQFTKDGNIYMVHGEPLSLSDTFKLDSNYMGFLHECRRHRNSDVRKMSELIVRSIGDDVEKGKDVLGETYPFDRRSDAWASIQGSSDATFFGHQNQLSATGDNQHHSSAESMNHSPRSTVIQQMNHGEINTEVYDLNYGEETHRSSLKHSSSSNSSSNNLIMKKYNYYNTDNKGEKTKLDELVFPNSLSENQRHLIRLHLQRLPDSLPMPPPPWKNWNQLLLDELNGRMEIGEGNKCLPVWNPVSLMSAYCQRLITNGVGLKDDGQFQIEFAETVLQKRNKRAIHERAYEMAQRNCSQKSVKRANPTRQKRKGSPT